ncbi:hypothetical protein B0H14DRAFT_2680516 [Mycena olivaceomarginata]|nr:hypothetical protein B0H14DRAFT_2680516 [Mycena olivaceomarginata]
MATLTTDEYDPYQDAHTLPHRTQLQTGSSTLSPNRANFEKSALITESSSPETGRERNHTGTIILTGVLIVFAVALVVLGLLLQVFAVHVYHVADRAVYTTAPLGMSVPVTIGLAGYLLAGRWLEASRVEGRDRPTPYQLGILMNTLSGANLAALWVSGNYIARRGVTPGGKSLSRPPMLRHAVFMLSFFLALAYGITGVETWLGSVSLAVSYPVTKITSEGPFPLFGLRVNQTLCDETKDALFNEPYECGLNHGLGWNATTLGVKSICTSVTSQCLDARNLGPNAGLMTNCSASVNFNTTALLTDICNSYGANFYGGPLGPAGVPLNCTENPNATKFRWGAEIISTAYNINNNLEQFVGDTGFFLHGNRGGFNLLTCEIESLAVTYHYFNGSYTLLAREPSDLAQGQRIADGSWAGLYYVPIAVDGAGLYSGSYADAFSARLSLVTLATTVYVVEPVEALRMENTRNLIGSRLPLAPLLILFTLAFIYCVSVVMITVMAVTETQRSPLTAVARSRILDPATAISTAYGPEEAKRRATSTVHELFGHETAADRLTMGVDIGLPVVRRGTLEPGEL